MNSVLALRSVSLHFQLVISDRTHYSRTQLWICEHVKLFVPVRYRELYFLQFNGLFPLKFSFYSGIHLLSFISQLHLSFLSFLFLCGFPSFSSSSCSFHFIYGSSPNTQGHSCLLIDMPSSCFVSRMKKQRKMAIMKLKLVHSHRKEVTKLG